MNKHGFTLVELLVAASLFVVAALAFGYILRASLLSLKAAETRSRCAYVLQTKMEELRLLSFNSLPAMNNTPFAEGKGKIYVAPVLTDLLSIRLELTQPAGKPALQLFTLRSRY